MSLVDNGSGNNMVMPVAPMYGGGGGYGSNGFGWGDGWLLPELPKEGGRPYGRKTK